jgi:hypothetical protein
MGLKKSKNQVANENPNQLETNGYMNNFDVVNETPHNQFNQYQSNSEQMYYNMYQQMQQQAMFQEIAKEKLYSKQYADEALSRLFWYGN